MKYFLTYAEIKQLKNTSCYHEFYRGKWNFENCEFWNQDSLYIDDDAMYNLELDLLIMGVTEDYAPFGETPINREQWNEICEKTEEIGGELLKAICEITPWMQETFKEHKFVTILGI